MVREHQSYRHKTHEFPYVNKDILRQKQDNSTAKTKLSCSKNKTIMQQKQGYHAAETGLSCSRNRAIMQQKQGYHTMKKAKKKGSVRVETALLHFNVRSLKFYLTCYAFDVQRWFTRYENYFLSISSQLLRLRTLHILLSCSAFSSLLSFF